MPATPQPTIEPWERRLDETEAAWEAFKTYRDMPHRSARAVSRQLAKSWPLISRWSAKYDWVERANALDRHNDEAWLNALFSEQVRAAKEANEYAGMVHRKIGARLAEIDAGKLSLEKGAPLLFAAEKAQRDALDAARAILDNERAEETQPPVVVISGADELS